ncbi:hypothetical protein [Mesorhizobium sp. B2-3-4]|uniref:hypothetical protein n=1 Tax=Mesorhizobium sp. B2-3-4 TaxID=2589959 RepID=UPI00112E48C0|nr:hypothetical protein [Mesorhizobium sp. B2-3-4]TPM27927.1 hypothetical protein FJ967_30210 [Mesorhizobium sp. B2-3-4]
MKSVLVVAVAALAAFCLNVPAQAAGFANIVLSATKGGEAQSDFPADTPVIYVSADLVDIQSASTITFSWISVDSHGAAPANYTIDKVDLDVGSNTEADSQLTKPTAGWPAGTYRVDLSIDGTVADSVPFSIP